MSAKRVSLDTNILIYAIDKDAGEKQTMALQLIEKCVVEYDCVLTLQSLSEFYAATTRKGILEHDEASAFIKDWQILFPTITPSSKTIDIALKTVGAHKLSFWDAMLWAVVRENKVSALFSEDFQSGRELEGVTFINPFSRENKKQ